MVSPDTRYLIPDPNKTIRMKTFILIHGSWHSSWNWHRVSPILEKQGHGLLQLICLVWGKDKTPIAMKD